MATEEYIAPVKLNSQEQYRGKHPDVARQHCVIA